MVLDGLDECKVLNNEATRLSLCPGPSVAILSFTLIFDWVVKAGEIPALDWCGYEARCEELLT